MLVAMVKHTKYSKGYWFEVPLDVNACVGTHVLCKTSHSMCTGVVHCLSSFINEDAAKTVLSKMGARFPLAQIVKPLELIALEDIVIPTRFAEHPPQNAKLCKRFLEYYHTGDFHTNIVVDHNNVLMDGYTAYLVAGTLGVHSLHAIRASRTKEGCRYV